jgi:hypothetical protein
MVAHTCNSGCAGSPRQEEKWGKKGRKEGREGGREERRGMNK